MSLSKKGKVKQAQRIVALGSDSFVDLCELAGFEGLIVDHKDAKLLLRLIKEYLQSEDVAFFVIEESLYSKLDADTLKKIKKYDKPIVVFPGLSIKSFK